MFKSSQGSKAKRTDGPKPRLNIPMSLYVHISFSENEVFKGVHLGREGVMAASVAGFTEICWKNATQTVLHKLVAL